jgi:hypothetical protein
VVLQLHSARLKLERAQEHIESLEEIVEDWLATDAYTVSRETDPGDWLHRFAGQGSRARRLTE